MIHTRQLSDTTPNKAFHEIKKLLNEYVKYTECKKREEIKGILLKSSAHISIVQEITLSTKMET